VKDQEGRTGGKERGLRGTKAGSVERLARPIHVPGEDAAAQTQRCLLTRRRPGSDIASTLDETFTLQLVRASDI
jgi:hypothetical protein